MKINIFFIIIVLLVIVAVSGCTSNSTSAYHSINASHPVPSHHFENENISFDYPKNWAVTFYDNRGMPGLNYWTIEIYDQNHPEKLLSILADKNSRELNGTLNIKIADQPTTYDSYISTIKRFAFEKNGIYYLITISNWNKSNENEYETILGSINITGSQKEPNQNEYETIFGNISIPSEFSSIINLLN